MAKKLLAALVMVMSASPLFARGPAFPVENEREAQDHRPVQNEAQSQIEPQTITGTATYYAHRFEGRRTANGETFRHAALTAAHATLPFGTLAVITNLRTGKWVVVRITDRLPSQHTLIDLTHSAAKELKMLRAGRIKVSMQVLEPPKTP